MVPTVARPQTASRRVARWWDSHSASSLFASADEVCPLAGQLKPSPDRVDPLAGELGDTEAKVGVSLSAGPRLDTQFLDLVDRLNRANGADRSVASTLHPSRMASSTRSTSKLTGSPIPISLIPPSSAERKKTSPANVLKLTGRATGLPAERKITRPVPPPSSNSRHSFSSTVTRCGSGAASARPGARPCSSPRRSETDILSARAIRTRADDDGSAVGVCSRYSR
jgi:hypothetical protein